MTGLLVDPWFYATAVPAVILMGLAKGGLAGTIGFLAVPLMSLVIPPIQAAAIMLPILLFGDMASLWTWRGLHDRATLVAMLPGALAGIGIGWLTASLVTADGIRFLVGLVAITFVARWLSTTWRHGQGHVATPNRALGAFWGLVSGFASFVAHLGGPPFQVYALPLRLDPKVLAGTGAIFFSVVNVVKLVPYFALGQFDATNLSASLVLLPLAPLATFAGAWLVRRMRPEIFYPFAYGAMTIVALKLLYDGAGAILG